MAEGKSYQQLQEAAVLLGIKKNQSAEALVAAITEATTPEAVASLQDLIDELQVAAKTVSVLPKDVDDALEKVTELHEAQFADRNVYTEPYLTGLANGLLMAIGAIKGGDVSKQLLKPITQVAVKGAKVLTGRQLFIKQASKYVTMRGGTGALRSGLTPDDIKEADRIMKALGVEKDKYTIPAE